MFVDRDFGRRITRVVRRGGQPRSYARFVQPDPLGYADSPNLYAYVGNDPINFVDPAGLTGRSICNRSNEGFCTTLVFDDSSLVRQTAGCGIDFVTGAMSGPGCSFGSSSNPVIVVKGPLPDFGLAQPEPFFRWGGSHGMQYAPQVVIRPQYCTSFAFGAATAAQQFGSDLSNFASGVVAAGLIGRSPHVIAAGEIVGGVGLASQSVGSLGKFVVSGNTSAAALDAAGVVSSFLKTQTRAAQIVTGHTFGAAITGAQDLGNLDPCG